MIPAIEIDERYLVRDSGTSDGTQIKYFKDNKWYKVDRYGGEGIAEELASILLKNSNLPENSYVKYKRVLINNSEGCVSDNFLKKGESYITLYRLYSNIYGKDMAAVTSRMDYDDAIDYVLEFCFKNTGLDIREYLANTFALDALILNEDRHFNNMGVIYDGTGFRPAPIFDNGKSLFVGNKGYDPGKTIKENRKVAHAKAFSGSFDLNKKYLEKYCSVRFDIDKTLEAISDDNEVSQVFKGLINPL